MLNKYLRMAYWNSVSPARSHFRKASVSSSFINNVKVLTLKATGSQVTQRELLQVRRLEWNVFRFCPVPYL